MWYDARYFMCNGFFNLIQYELKYWMDSTSSLVWYPEKSKYFLPELHVVVINIFFKLGYHPCAKHDVQQSIKSNILCFALTLNKVMLEWWWSNVAVFSNNASKDTNIHCIIITLSCHFLSLSLYHFSVSLLHCV